MTPISSELRLHSPRNDERMNKLLYPISPKRTFTLNIFYEHAFIELERNVDF